MCVFTFTSSFNLVHRWHHKEQQRLCVCWALSSLTTLLVCWGRCWQVCTCAARLQDCSSPRAQVSRVSALARAGRLRHRRRAAEMAASFASRVGSVYSDAWPTAGATPNLAVRAAHPGRLPPCAQRGEPVFWVHQAGLFRSFAAHVEHLRSFLDASSSCWFVVLFTLDIKESAVTAWSRGAKTLHFAGDPGQEVRDAIAALQNATNGGAAYVLASRSHEKPPGHRGEAAHTSGTNPKLEAFAHVLREQNVGASALLGREVVAWHSLAADPDDVVLQTRPDVIFKAPIDVPKLRALFRGATTARVS